MDGPCTVLGGLPLIADVWSDRDYWGEYDCGVDGLYWQKRDGSRGKEIPQKLLDRIEKYDPYWEALVTEQVFDYLSCQNEESSEAIEDTIFSSIKLEPMTAAKVLLNQNQQN